MDEQESFFKREEDRKWREKVDHEQVTLMTGHQVTSKRLDDVEDKLDELDRTVRGDVERETGGLIERLHRQETEIAKLNAVVFMDAAGEKGLQEAVKELKRREKNAGYRWKFWTAIVGFLLTLTGLIFTNLDRLTEMWRRDSGSATIHSKTRKRGSTRNGIKRPIERSDDELDLSE